VTPLRQHMLQELQRRNYSPSTIRSYSGAVQQFAEHFHYPPEQLGHERVRRYKVFLLQEKKLEPSTVEILGMRKLPLTAAEELLEIIMRRYERASTLLTFNRPVDDWGKLLGDSAAVTAMLDRLLHHGHVLKRPAQLAHQNRSYGRCARMKAKPIRMPRQRTPGGVATRDPEASHNEASPNESMQKHETLRRPAHQANRRGSRLPIPLEPAPVSSALDHSARRDPGRATPP
jgi:hypothetical protein